MYFSKGKGRERASVKIQLPDDIFGDTDSEDENYSYTEDEDEEKLYKYSKIIEDPSDTCLKRLLQLYDNYDTMSKEE